MRVRSPPPPLGGTLSEEIAEEMIFEDNLQEFATKVGFIVALESNPGNDIDAAKAFKEIKDLYKKLKKSKKKLNI